MSNTPTTPPRKIPNRARPVVSFTLAKPVIKKLGQIKRRWKAGNRSEAVERMIDQAHATEFPEVVS